jgi:hypothetical protein
MLLSKTRHRKLAFHMKHTHENIMEAVRQFKSFGIKVRCVIFHSSENIRYRSVEHEASSDIKRKAVWTRFAVSLIS